MKNIREFDNFIVEYNEEVDYLDEAIEHLAGRIPEILKFFQLDNFSEKTRIVLFDDLDQYIEHVNKYTDYLDYMCADTFDGNVNSLTVEEARKEEAHRDMNVFQFKHNLVHEFVHVCQEKTQIEGLSNNDDSWFWEALATNLGNPELFDVIDFDISREELIDFNNLENNYPYAYTIGKYIFDTYSDDEILEFVRYPKKVMDELDNIILGVKCISKGNSK